MILGEKIYQSRDIAEIVSGNPSTGSSASYGRHGHGSLDVRRHVENKIPSCEVTQMIVVSIL